jgi:outer membrane receptor protein involved in Fe transport
MNTRLPLSLAIIAALGLAPGLAFTAPAPQQDTAAAAADDDDATELEEVVVTGSRIPRAQVEGPAPITVFTVEDIQREGFNTIADALATLTQQSGAAVQTEFDSGTFTQNANVIDLRGLGPGRILVLFNGRRATDYPLPFNGQSNIVNLAAIPAAAVERIEFLSGGASAIYGSDAVAGVLNIVMKKSYDGHLINYRWGDTSDGGGQSHRVQAVGGIEAEALNLVYAYEFLKRDPIWAFQRDYIDSNFDNPDPVNHVNSRNVLIFNPLIPAGSANNRYIDPGDVCGRWPELERSFRPRFGNFCGRPDDISQFTIRNQDENHSLYGFATYDLGDSGELWASLNYWNAKGEFNTGTPFWTSTLFSNPLFIDTSQAPAQGLPGRASAWQRIFTASEMGGREVNNQKFDEELTDFALGWRGYVFGDYQLELNYGLQQYDLERERLLFVTDAIEDYFLRPQVGVFQNRFPIHRANIERMLRPMTPAEFAATNDIDRTTADSENQLLQGVLTGDLWELPAGPIGFAAVAEFGTQEYDINLDPRLLAGEFWGFTGTEGAGERDRYALGLETKIPLHATLTGTLAARYDKYDDITDVDDAVTYNAGLEWRPIDALLVRGSYATSFRAPDMHFVFAGPSGFFTTVTDEFRCRTLEPGTPFPDCTYSTEGISGQRQGNPALKEEEGDSFTVGFVWDVIENMSLSVDYYDIELEDIVGDLSIARLLEVEADCRIGRTVGGAAVDPNSAECADALARIARLPRDGSPTSEELVSIVTGPINRAIQRTSGIDATFRYTLPTANWGVYRLDLGYSHVLEQEAAQFADDPIEDQRDDPQYFGFRSSVRGSITWAIEDFTATLFGTRVGSVPNWAETGRIGPWMVYNANLSYDVTDAIQVSLIVNNLRNSRPPEDETFDVYPFFSTGNYNAVGREYFVQIDYRFD